MNDDDLCVCGHKLEDHHRSWFRNGGMIVEECEFEGYNETGGMMYIAGKWLEHCKKFRLTCDGSNYDNGCRCVDCVLRYSC